MDDVIKTSVYELLETIDEAIQHLWQREDEGLRRMLRLGRQRVTQILEESISCSLEQRIEIGKLSDEEWFGTVCRIMMELEDPFCPQNKMDNDFLQLLNYVWNNSKEFLVAQMRQNLDVIQKQSNETYNMFVSYFSKFPLWGTFDPKKGDYTTLYLRAEVLKRHSYDFLWLYRRLEDYHSRRTLWAILLNWAILNLEQIHLVKSIFPDYWEPDVFPNNQGDVMVDIGAFTGDSIVNYVNYYGDGYKKIYAYEISEGSYQALCNNTASLHNIIPRRKGVGSCRSTMFVAESSDSSANQLRGDGEQQQAVEVVPLDEDIQEPVTFVKMDIEGAEQDALLGCEQIIRTQHPKLAICTYHGYEDIWKIPVMIDSMYPDYKMYLRHYGGNLIPTEFVLLCKEEKSSVPSM